jgi:hypothetical protein
MENIFEHINHPSDIERLNDCLKAVFEAGLKLDKYTQAGVNQGSGNVWVWSEDWAGCVYCSIGFDVAWSYSCPECGEEHDFESYADMAHYAAKWVGVCDSCANEEEADEVTA